MATTAPDSTADGSSRVYWTAQEYQRLLDGLIEVFPDRGYDGATFADQFDFTDEEFREAMHISLPQERWRAKIYPNHYELIRNNLMKAAKVRSEARAETPAPAEQEGLTALAQAMLVAAEKTRRTAPVVKATPKAEAPVQAAKPLQAAKPVQAAKPKRNASPLVKIPRGKRPRTPMIRWTEEEYRLFALSVHTMFPELDCLHSHDLALLRTPMLNSAALIFPEDRQRYFPALEKPRAKLLAIYERARQTRHPLFYGPLEAPLPVLAAKVAETAPVPAVPDVPAVAPVAPVAVAKVDTVEPALTKRGTPKKNVIWSAAEWLTVATELDRTYPAAHYPQHPERLTGLKPADVDFAQRVLPVERRRRNLRTFAWNMLAPNLTRAFARVQELADMARLEAHAAELEAAPPPPPAVVPVNVWEATFKPMMALMATELVPALVPALVASLSNDVTGLLAGQLKPIIKTLLAEVLAEALRPAPAAPAPAPAPAATLAATEEPGEAPTAGERLREVAADRRPMIGVVGTLPIQAETLKSAFPSYEIVTLNTEQYSRVAGSLQKASRVIGMVNFMNHSMDGMLAKQYGARYTRVSGGVSAIKRQIAIWDKTGTVNQVAA